MTTELIMLALAIVLGLVQIILAANSSTKERGLDWNIGPRDDVLAPLAGVAGRLDRALRNFLETFPLFAAAVLIAGLAGRHNWLTACGAVLYVAGRIAYVPLYAYGIRIARTAAWGIATLGIVLVLIGLI
jgi:uncharacterized MAPEG superfamily protein